MTVASNQIEDQKESRPLSVSSTKVSSSRYRGTTVSKLKSRTFTKSRGLPNDPGDKPDVKSSGMISGTYILGK